MSSEADNELQDALRALQAAFAAKLPIRLQELNDALRSCLEKVEDVERMEKLHRMLHTLAGSAGTFDLAEIGSLVHSVEGQVSQLIKEGRWTEEDLRGIGAILSTL